MLRLGEPVTLLGQAGLGFLFFLVEMEIDAGRFTGRPLGLAVLSWSFSLGLTAVVVMILYLYWKDFTKEERLSFALCLATALLLIVAIIDIGLYNGNMRESWRFRLSLLRRFPACCFPRVWNLLARRDARPLFQL